VAQKGGLSFGCRPSKPSSVPSGLKCHFTWLQYIHSSYPPRLAIAQGSNGSPRQFICATTVTITSRGKASRSRVLLRRALHASQFTASYTASWHVWHTSASRFQTTSGLVILQKMQKEGCDVRAQSSCQDWMLTTLGLPDKVQG
jgi:hypothetical protein